MWLHDVMLEGKNVAVKMREEWEFFPNVGHSQVVRVGEDIGGNFARPQARVKLDHRIDWRKDVAESVAELIQMTGVARARADLFIELFLMDEPRFVAAKKRGMIDEPLCRFR